MKKQSGFTLIELLLVLAIIGIISAIAIPALLGQRARARDKSAQANVTSILPDMVSTWDKLKEAGTPPTSFATWFGAASTPIIPSVFTAVNPWNTTGHLTGYAQALTAEAAATPGVNTAGAAVAGTLGQVQLGFIAPAAVAGAAATSGVVAGAVYMNSALNGANVFVQSAGLD